MVSIFAVLSCLGYSFLLNRFAKWPLESSLLFVISCIILLLYFSALIGFLVGIASLCFFCGILLFIFFAVGIVKKKQFYLFTSPGAVFFLLGALFLFVTVSSSYYGYFITSDDFSHWARITKIVLLNNGLAQADDPIMFQDYPPGTALWYYYFLNLTGFDIATMFFANGVILLAAGSQLLQRLPRKRPLLLIGCALFFYWNVHFFGTGFHTLMVDLLIGVLFASGVVGYWLSDRGALSTILRVSPVILILPIIKTVGIIFAAIMIVIVILDQIWLIRHHKSTYRALMLALFTAILMLLIFVSWQHHFSSLNTALTYPEITIDTVVNAFNSDTSTNIQRLTIHHFIERITDVKTLLKLSLFVFALLLICKNENLLVSRGSAAIHSLVLTGGLVGYLFFLLLVYLFLFGDFQGPMLASITRYSGSYFVGMYFILFAVLLHQYLQMRKKNTVMLLFLLVFSIGTAIPSTRFVKNEMRKVFSYDHPKDRVLLNSYASMVAKKVLAKKKVYFIWQQSKGMELLEFSYGVIPVVTNQSCNSISDGYKYFKEGLYTCDMDIEKFKLMLSHYDYLMIGHADMHFWNTYASIFDREATGDGYLYKIINDEEDVKLVNLKF